MTKEDYQNVISKPLKLKSSGSKISKKKKKHKKQKKDKDQSKPSVQESSQSAPRYSTLTKAERKHREVSIPLFLFKIYFSKTSL